MGNRFHVTLRILSVDWTRFRKPERNLKVLAAILETKAETILQNHWRLLNSIY